MKNQKTIRRLLAAALALACCFGMTSCSAESLLRLFWQEPTPSVGQTASLGGTPTHEPVQTGDPDCDHQFGDWKVVVEPTCEDEGSAVRFCALCGAADQGVYRALGHAPVPMEDVPSTCTQGGSVGGVRCSRCKEYLTPPTLLLPKGHANYVNGLCSACGTPKNSAEGLAFLDLYNGTYGYTYLASTSNGSAKQAFYQRLDEAVRVFHTDPSSVVENSMSFAALNYAELGLSLDEALAVWTTFRNDNPLYYWLSNQISYNEQILNVMTLSQYANGTARMERNASVYNGIAAYLSVVPAEATPYQTALTLHNAIVGTVDYAYSSSGVPESADWAHSCVGVFEGRGAVCEGFAEAYQILMNICGVDCLIVTGIGNGEAHAWNLLEIEDVWYGVDLTWDDNNQSTAPYRYFCVSASVMAEDHTPDLPTGVGMDFLYALPAVSEYGLEWVTVYKNGEKQGVYSNPDKAFASMTDPQAEYTLQLGTDDPLLHSASAYYVRGELPVVKSLTVVGAHTLLSGGGFTATTLYLTENVTLKGNLILKSLFLDGVTYVNLYTNGHALTAKADTRYYSAVMERVTVVQ